MTRIFQPADLDVLWQSLNPFFDRFTGQDWTRKHGKDWIFADVVYHLGYFNQMAVDALKHGDDKTVLPFTTTTARDLNAWNEQQFARRPARQTGRESWEYFHTTQKSLRDAYASTTPDAPIFLPILVVRGWRVAQLALEYTFFHNWLHYMETHLRHSGTLPDLPEDVMWKALDFLMEVTAGAVNTEKADRHLVWVLRLSGKGGGVWTFTIDNHCCEVVAGEAAKPDITITSDIATYMQTSFFGMMRPLRAILTGRYRIRGITKATFLKSVFSPLPNQEWKPVTRGALTGQV